jgi:hypothetical protein
MTNAASRQQSRRNAQKTFGKESKDGNEDRRNPILPIVFPLSSHCLPIIFLFYAIKPNCIPSNQELFGTPPTSLEVRSKAILGQVQPKDLATIMDHSDLRRTGANSEGELVIWVLLVSTNKNPKILG